MDWEVKMAKSNADVWNRRHFAVAVISAIIALVTLIVSLPPGTPTNDIHTPTPPEESTPTQAKSNEEDKTTPEEKSTPMQAKSNEEDKKQDEAWLSIYLRDASVIKNDANLLDAAISNNSYDSIYVNAKLLSQNCEEATFNNYLSFTHELTGASNEYVSSLKQAKLWATYVLKYLEDNNKGNRQAALDDAVQATQYRNSYYEHAGKASQLVNDYQDNKIEESFKYMS